MNTLSTGIKNVKNVGKYIIGRDSLSCLPDKLNKRRNISGGPVLFYIDEYFIGNQELLSKIGIQDEDLVTYVEVAEEPTTLGVDELVLHAQRFLDGRQPSVVVGIGGGIAMDTAKAVSNLLTNPGTAESYQGWDLLNNPGVYKIGIPTISGTGAESTRTCVMTNYKTGLKLGMNSDHTVFDEVVLDPTLTKTVPRDQYFWTASDAYIHSFESLEGSYRNLIGDALSASALSLSCEVLQSDNMQSDCSREKLMVASYLGGAAIATTYVGVVHPFSAGLSVIFGIHHCIANCIAMRVMQSFYPRYYDQFWGMVKKQNINIPRGICLNLTDEVYKKIYDAILIHEKPLTNALGLNYKEILSYKEVVQILKKM